MLLISALNGIRHISSILRCINPQMFIMIKYCKNLHTTTMSVQCCVVYKGNYIFRCTFCFSGKTSRKILRRSAFWVFKTRDRLSGCRRPAETRAGREAVLRPLVGPVPHEPAKAGLQVVRGGAPARDPPIQQSAKEFETRGVRVTPD